MGLEKGGVGVLLGDEGKMSGLPCHLLAKGNRSNSCEQSSQDKRRWGVGTAVCLGKPLLSVFSDEKFRRTGKVPEEWSRASTDPVNGEERARVTSG